MIIITAQCFPPRTGGIETLMYSLARMLSRRDREVMVFADGHGTPGETAFDHNQSFAIKRTAGIRPLRRYKKARMISKLLLEGRVQGIIADTWKSLEYLRAPAVCPVLCLVHGTELPDKCPAGKRSRIEKALAKAAVIIPNSEYTAKRLEYFSINSSKIHVIHPGITEPDGSEMEPRTITRPPGKHPVLVSVGRLEARKGIDTVINLMPRLTKKYPALCYLVIGEGSQKKSLEDTVRKQGLREQVKFIGAVDEKQRNAYLKTGDLFVLPGRREGDDVEGFGIAFIEAAWFGLPAIAGRDGGAPEAVIDKLTGLTCRGEDEESVYATICRVLDDEDLRRRLGENAKDRARDFLWPKVINKYISLLNDNKASG